MKVIGIVGSPRKGGNTEILTAHTLEAIQEEGLETELFLWQGWISSPVMPAAPALKKKGVRLKMIYSRYI